MAEPQKKSYRAREARLTIDCSAEQKRKIKMLAASRDMSITDFMLELVEEKYTWCPLGLSHIPNAETVASIEGTDAGKGLVYCKDFDDFVDKLGLK